MFILILLILPVYAQDCKEMKINDIINHKNNLILNGEKCRIIFDYKGFFWREYKARFSCFVEESDTYSSTRDDAIRNTLDKLFSTFHVECNNTNCINELLEKLVISNLKYIGCHACNYNNKQYTCPTINSHLIGKANKTALLPIIDAVNDYLHLYYSFYGEEAFKKMYLDTLIYLY